MLSLVLERLCICVHFHWCTLRHILGKYAKISILATPSKIYNMSTGGKALGEDSAPSIWGKTPTLVQGVP